MGQGISLELFFRALLGETFAMRCPILGFWWCVAIECQMKAYHHICFSNAGWGSNRCGTPTLWINGLILLTSQPTSTVGVAIIPNSNIQNKLLFVAYNSLRRNCKWLEVLVGTILHEKIMLNGSVHASCFKTRYEHFLILCTNVFSCRHRFPWKMQGIVKAWVNFILQQRKKGHDQDRPEVPFRTASLRLRTVEKGLGKRLKWARTWPSKPGVPLSVVWSTRLVMPAQPAPRECRHKYK